MLATVAATDSDSTVRKKYGVFIYSEAEAHAMCAIYKQTRKLCVLQYYFLFTVVFFFCNYQVYFSYMLYFVHYINLYLL